MQSCCELHCVIKSKRKTGRGREKEEQERTRTRRSQTPELEICPLESKRTEALLNKAMASTVECSLPRNTTTSARPSTAAEMSSTSASSSSKMRMRSVCLHPKKEKRMGQKSTEQWIKGGCGMNPTDTHAHKHAHTHTQTHRHTHALTDKAGCSAQAPLTFRDATRTSGRFDCGRTASRAAVTALSAASVWRTRWRRARGGSACV